MNDDALARKAMHVQRDVFAQKQKCWLADLHSTLHTTDYGRVIWGKWNEADNFRVPCVRVTLNEKGEHVYEGWSDVMKGVFSSAAQEVSLAEINRPNARQ